MAATVFRRRLRPKVERIIVISFIAWTLLCFTVWIILPKSHYRDQLLKLVEPYLVMVGLSQDFWVFAPDVNTSSADIVADVTLADGSMVSWQYPKNSATGILEKPFKERYREFATTVLSRKNRFLLPDMASYIAREVSIANPNNPPRLISLCVEWKRIPPPAGDGKAETGKAEFFRARVEPDE